MCLTKRSDEPGFFLNAIWVRLTGCGSSVFRDGIFFDVDEYEVLFCSVNPKKGKLVYETSFVAANLFTANGIRVPLENRKRHISALHFLTDEELNLMKRKGVNVVILPNWHSQQPSQTRIFQE